MRRGKLGDIVTSGKLEGKRGRGRTGEKILDGLAGLHEKRTPEQLRGNTKWKESGEL